MSNEFQEILVWLTAGALFLLLLSTWLIGTVLVYVRQTTSEEKISERLHGPSDASKKSGKTLRLWHQGKISTTLVPSRVRRMSPANILGNICRGVGWNGSVPMFLLSVFCITAFACLSTYIITENMILAGGWIAAIPIVLQYLGKKRVSKQEDLFEQQFADALGLAARSLRAGHPLLAAFEVIVDELDPPVSLTFAEIVQQQELGISLEKAIAATAEKSSSTDVKLFAAATIIQIRSGGNMADMMDRLVDVMRARIRLQRRVRVLTAQTQLSKRILIALPIFLLFLLAVTDPEYLEPLFTTTLGKYMLITAASFLAFGTWVMNKVATLRY